MRREEGDSAGETIGEIDMGKEISIVIPVYNRSAMVKATLDSVVRQTYRPLHLIVVDNNSKDGTLDVLNRFKAEQEAADFKITVIEEPRQGAAIARNTGARAVESEWLMFFDSDDEMDERLLETYAEKIEECRADLVMVKADYEEAGVVKEMFSVKEKFLSNHVIHGYLNTARYAIRRSLYAKAGEWNETLKGWDDWELGVRVLLQAPRVEVVEGKPLVHVLSHADSITGQDFSSRREWWEAAVDAVENDIKNADTPQKAVLLKYVEFRRILLAGNYYREKQYRQAEELYSATYSRVRHDKVMRWLYPLVYRYIGKGMRGAGRIVKKIIR